MLTGRETLQVLTVVPNKWQVQKAAIEFGASKCTIQKALSIKR